MSQSPSQRQQKQHPEASEPYARLVFQTSGKAVVKDILRHTTLIGSSRGCNLQLISERISRSHCVITLDAGRLRVRDLRSKSGVKVNGVPVEVCTLHHGDRLLLDKFELELQTNLVPDETVAIRPPHSEIEQLEQDREQFQHDLVRLQQDREHVQREREQLETDRQDWETRRDQGEHQLIAAEAYLQELSEQTTAIGQDRRQIEILQKELTEQLAGLEEQRLGLIESREQLHSDVASFGRRQNEFHAQLAEYEKQHSQIAAVEAELQQAREALDAGSQERRHEHQSLTQHHLELQQTLSQLRQDHNMLQGRLVSKEEALKQAVAGEQQLLQTIAQQQGEIARLVGESDLRQQELQAMTNAIGDLQQQAEEAGAETTAQERQLAEREAALEAALAELESEREQFRAETAEVHSRTERLAELENRLHVERETLSQQGLQLASDRAALAEDRRHLEKETDAKSSTQPAAVTQTATWETPVEELQQKERPLQQDEALLAAQRAELTASQARLQEELQAFAELQQQFREETALANAYKQSAREFRAQSSPSALRRLAALLWNTFLITIAITAGYFATQWLLGSRVLESLMGR